MTDMAPTSFVQGDRDTVNATLTDDDGFPHDLTGRTVTFRLWSPRHGTVVDRQATVVGDVTGDVEVVLVPADLAKPGRYKAEFSIAGGDADPTTTPRSEPISVSVRQNGAANQS